MESISRGVLPAFRGDDNRDWSSDVRQGYPLLVVLLLAADGLQLGEHGVDVEVVALLLGWLEFRFLAGGFGGRQQSGAAIGGVDRLLLGSALHLEVELDLRAQSERHR